MTETEHLPDPDDYAKIARCIIIPAEIEEHRARIIQLAAERARLLLELRQAGHGLGELAGHLGISKTRAQQLARPVSNPGP